jgi:hypothetical protein
VPSYVQFSMPRGDAELLLAELENVRLVDLQMSWDDRYRIKDRIKAAIGGKDLRVKNRYPKVKRPRVELDLRKKAS